MEEIYKQANIPKLDIMQQELLACIKHDWREKGMHAFEYDNEYILESCPTFAAWVLPRSKVGIYLMRFYVTTPFTDLKAHIDGNEPTYPFGLNIPIVGNEGSTMDWYETTSDNIKQITFKGYRPAWYPRKPNELKMIASVETTLPYFVKTDILHGVHNQTDHLRLMFVTRWNHTQTENRNIEDSLHTEDLFV